MVGRLVTEDRLRCPQCGSASPTFKAMSDTVLAISEGEQVVDPILERLVEAAPNLVGARYAVIGVPDGEGGFAKFITSGMTRAQWDALGELPRTHGMLGAMLESTKPYRTTNIQGDPRFEGWPAEHPNMRPFPRRADRLPRGRDRSLLSDREDGQAARRVQRDGPAPDRDARGARQTLFSIGLTAEAAVALVESDPGRAKVELERLRELTRDAMEGLRSSIFELRPAKLEADGLAATLRKHVDVLRRVTARSSSSASTVTSDCRPRWRRGCSASRGRRSRTRSGTPARGASRSAFASRVLGGSDRG
jgi:Histidine kinase